MTIKKFFIYFILIVLFFIFSRVAIAVSIHTTYQYKSYQIKSTIPIIADVQATSVSGIVKGKILNNTEENIQNKFMKIECYSKNNILLGTKYIEIENINKKDTFEYEVRFNYNRIDNVIIDIVDEVPEGVPEEDKISDPEMSLTMLATALIFLCII